MKNNKKQLFLKKVIALFFIMFVSTVFLSDNLFAQQQQGGANTGGGTQQGGTNPPPTGFTVKLENPIGIGDSIPEIIEKVIENVILPIGGTIAVIYIIYGGFLLVTARGNETKLGDAKKTLTRAAIGTAILLGSWAIAEAIQNTINQLVG